MKKMNCLQLNVYEWSISQHPDWSHFKNIHSIHTVEITSNYLHLGTGSSLRLCFKTTVIDTTVFIYLKFVCSILKLWILLGCLHTLLAAYCILPIFEVSGLVSSNCLDAFSVFTIFVQHTMVNLIICVSGTMGI